MKYRSDIDGLRALAVLSVVLFHFGFPGFYGGYVGVDIFFVISGYLISGIIIDEAESGRFSVVEFYRRRIIRIFPALFAMLVIVALVGSYVLLPDELLDLGGQILGASFFYSNAYFFKTANYFGGDSHAKFLLHTWSLSVEEQFYIVWPFLLVLFHKNRTIRKKGIAAVFVISCILLSQYLVYIDQSFAFYMMPARIWEFAVGTVAVYVARGNKLDDRTSVFLGLIGLLAILIPVKIYNEQVVFPGFSALPPCIGTACVLAVNGRGFASKFISNKVFTFFGKISYSLYLWHWPVVVFASVFYFHELNLVGKVVLFVISVVLGYLSWRFVEQPVRMSAKKINAKLAFKSAGLLFAFALLVVLIVNQDGGLKLRFDGKQNKIATYISYHGDEKYREGSCFVVQKGEVFDAKKCLSISDKKKNILIIGDSHAAHLWPGFKEKFPDYNILQATHTGCRPLIDNRKHGDCEEFYNVFLHDWFKSNKVDILIMAGRWARPDMNILPATIGEYKRYTDKLILMGPVPQYVSSLPRLLVWKGDEAVLNTSMLKDAILLDPQMANIAAKGGVSYVSPISLWCKNGKCLTEIDNVPVQFDYGHYTVEGSIGFAGMLNSIL